MEWVDEQLAKCWVTGVDGVEWMDTAVMTIAVIAVINISAGAGRVNLQIQPPATHFIL